MYRHCLVHLTFSCGQEKGALPIHYLMSLQRKAILPSGLTIDPVVAYGRSCIGKPPQADDNPFLYREINDFRKLNKNHFMQSIIENVEIKVSEF